MSFALSAGVTGLQAHQKMLDIAGNNLANVNTTAFKAKTISFSELMTETIKKASQPTATVGGTNPQQMGSGVEVAGIAADMAQGNIVNTGNPLDLAIEGEGYFVANDGSKNLYTRSGSFAVDANSFLVDPMNGYHIQRIGSVGESDNFQTAGNSNIVVPYDVAMAARATSQVTVAGNLSADAVLTTAQANVLTSDIGYTTNNGTTALTTTELDELDQFSGTFGAATTITASGLDPSGNALTDATGLTVTGATTLQDVIDHLNNNVLTSTEQVASLVNGKIRVTDVSSGYSLSDMGLTWADNGSATLTMPVYFEVSTVGGDHVKYINTTVYDSQGGRHVLSAAFTRTSTANTWDMLLTSVTGDIYNITAGNRRIRGIEFSPSDGSYSGLDTAIGDTSQFVVTFARDPSNPQTISIEMGTTSHLDGLTQFAGNSTAVARGQDGYEAGNLATVSVDNAGTIIGAFSNGIKRDIATVQITLFQNPAALESVGGNYSDSSANSGEAVATQALTGGAGSIHGGSLEKSNADVATEFVRMIQAQNGFQASARTIRVANDILRELTNIIR
ncbi:MAG: flagellar hook-basal body complex protein [Phycisphaerae bacterium]|nr:flagellar hook-basal body complex protein [Phycisphaerae bacterium]